MFLRYFGKVEENEVGQQIAVVCALTARSTRNAYCFLLWWQLVFKKNSAFFHIGNDHQVKVCNRSVSLVCYPNCPCLLSFILICCVFLVFLMLNLRLQ